jgi:hypothetical protein
MFTKKKPRTRRGQLYPRKLDTAREAAPTEKLSRASSLVYGRSLCVDFSRLKVFIERRAGDWLAEGRTVRSALVLTPDTMSIADRAPGCLLRPSDWTPYAASA